ncbi:TRAP transporter large permease [Vreelandella aquamarina]|uniref:TRAP transporter large permease n=1 Tax=Vreelandella aquamarina TaxID=77097 RepID=UPI000780239F|nr:TRAP transporter large permease [Halomonas axialensis]
MNVAVLVSMLTFIAIGVPIAVSLILASTIGINFFTSLPLVIIPQRVLSGINSFPLMAVPFFILAGNMMSSGGMSVRLVNVAKSLTSNIQGGLAISCVLTCMMFAAVSGSSVATTFAIGSILIPAMIRHGYPKPVAASIQASSAELGVLIPPSIPLILYGVSTDTSIGQLFLAGIGPGVLVAFALIAYVYVLCKIKGYGSDNEAEVYGFLHSISNAKAALFMPVIIIGGIYGGIFTPTEASAVAVAYAFVVSFFVYKTASWRELPGILQKSVISTVVIMMIIAAASLISYVVTRSGLSGLIATSFLGFFDSPVSFLIAVNLLLLLVGMFIEASAAILILAPILAPIAAQFGISYVHFGMIMVVNLALGMITPPLGVNLFAACSVAGIPLHNIIRSLVPFVLVIMACLAVVTFVPSVSLFLINAFY